MSLEKYIGTNNLMFSKLTTQFIQDQINSLSGTNKAKLNVAI